LSNLSIQNIDGGVVFVVKIIPSSSRTGLYGLLDDMLKIKVAAAAQKQKANKCLCEFLAKQLGVKTSAVCIISGQTSPIKHLQVSGISREMLLKKLNLDR